MAQPLTPSYKVSRMVFSLLSLSALQVSDFKGVSAKKHRFTCFSEKQHSPALTAVAPASKPQRSAQMSKRQSAFGMESHIVQDSIKM